LRSLAAPTGPRFCAPISSVKVMVLLALNKSRNMPPSIMKVDRTERGPPNKLTNSSLAMNTSESNVDPLGTALCRMSSPTWPKMPAPDEAA
jgi:hypothetical protein